ncbi:hypothetical protein HPB51_006698 [Rhipicephalus microplus]|uniref:Ricin B lectin domain-containing protein n=1 Tax=Rhipicephalus microplus TaxID=6941 RepID=A0A9J6E7L6_RHIMP|nr:hypothetical protein HPB51_006698 [Rhipicephalus microplus]
MKRSQLHRVPAAGGERLASLRQGSLCLDTLGGSEGSPVGLFACHGAGGNQHWSLASRLIAHGGLCVTLDEEQEGSLLLRPCGGHPSQVESPYATMLFNRVYPEKVAVAGSQASAARRQAVPGWQQRSSDGTTVPPHCPVTAVDAVHLSNLLKLNVAVT